ncbi:hypothetical protein KZ810_07905 [Sphingomonas sp. RHCKR47]|uniref:hypothetical protein n=1 Tax=Sphingomonas citricola TaxID=2862498 RepID=UPI001CA55456|nr:hypothetical protein [Sphingomonas citricola]MBW6523420.1 hypothetical protein [Sphingomonas citricola]
MTLRNAFADLATDETLQDVLAKLPAAPATAGGQATGNASLAQIVTLLTSEGGYLDGVETLLAAVRDKLIASPATDAKVEAVRALLAGTLAISAAALPLPAGAASAARQDLQLGLLAGTSGLGQSGKTPAASQRTTAGVGDAFTPIAGRTMNLVCSGGSGVVAQLERSFDNGATWYVKISDALRAATPETFTDTETEVGVQYRWNVTAIASGTVTLRISQ